MGHSGFMVKKRNLPLLLSFSALLVCILPHCQLRDWCGNLRKASGHVVCRLDQSASFRIFESTFYFPHSAILHFTHSSICINTLQDQYWY